MADIGRSTVAHGSRYEQNYPLGHEALDNFGAWYRDGGDSIKTATIQPMFRDIQSGYRESIDFRTQFDEDYAIDVDQMMATVLTKSEVKIIFCKYVKCFPARMAAKSLSTHDDKITANEYALRLEAVVARVDIALELRAEMKAIYA